MSQPTAATPHNTEVPHPGVVAHAISEPSPQLNLLSLAATIRRERSTVLKITLAVLLAALLTAFLLPNQYSSVASFIPPTPTSSAGAAALAGQLSSLGPASLLGSVKSSGDLYAGMLKSRSIADILIQRFDLLKVYGFNRESDAVKRLAANTTIEIGVKDTIVTITVKDRAAARAKALADGYLDALRETNHRLALTDSSQRREFFDQQLAREKNDLADAEVELKKTQEQSGLIAPTGQTTLQIQTIAQTRAQIAVRQVQLAALRQSATDQNERVIRLHSEIADLEGQVNRLEVGGINQGGAIPASKVPTLQLDFVRKEREVKYHEALFEMLAKQLEAARMDESRDAPLLQVLDHGSLPDRKSSPYRSLFALGGLVGGLLLGCIWVLIQEYMQSARSLFAPMSDLLPESK